MQTCARRAVNNLVQTPRDESLEYVRVMVEMERTADYTSNLFTALGKTPTLNL